jgi:putative colanic acid biosynthesis UDP-glucose lipid carrier transferase
VAPQARGPRVNETAEDASAAAQVHYAPRPATAPARAASQLLSDGSICQKAFQFGSTEAPTVTVVKRITGPMVAVGILAVCRWVYGLALNPQSLAFGVVVLLIASRVLSAPHLRTNGRGQVQSLPTQWRLLFELCCLFGLTTVLAAALNLPGVVTPGALLAWFVLAPVALLLSNHGALKFARWWCTHRAGHRHVIIGATEVGLELTKRVALGSSDDGFMGFFDFRAQGRLPPVPPGKWAGACSGLGEFVRRHAVDVIYIALPISSAPRIAELVSQLRDTTASVYFVPNILALDLVQPRCIEIHGIPALAVIESPFHGMSALRKRAFDLGAGFLALLLAAPLMLLIAVAIKLTSPGPVLFKQRRYGLNGETVQIFKFRSMTVCEDGPVVTQVSRDDHRLTAVGRILRRTSLDELPQIVNVISGKMSLVGPRPHAVAHNELYRKLISGYMIRHKVRPGITGWAQVNGMRGETDTLEKMDARIRYDLDYIRNWSLWLDCKILARTVGLMVRDDKAY